MLEHSRKLILTSHAKQRAQQFRMSVDKVYWSFWHSQEEPTPPGAKKYADRGVSEDTIYRRFETKVMVIKKIVDKYTNKDAYLMLTLYDQRMDLNNPQIDDLGESQEF